MSGSISDLTLLGGANARAVETALGVWEIAEALAVKLLVPGWYGLSKLLCNQCGAAGAMGKARMRPDGTRHADIAIPLFGYTSRAGIDPLPGRRLQSNPPCGGGMASTGTHADQAVHIESQDTQRLCPADE